MAGYDYKLDNTGDLDLSTAAYEWVAGSDQVRQAINIGLAIDRGEWFEDILVGVPWTETILSKPGSKSFMDSFIISYTTTNYEDVDRVVEYRSEIDGADKASVTFRALLLNGEQLFIDAGGV